MRRPLAPNRRHHRVLGDEGSVSRWTPYLTNVTDDPATTGTLKIFLTRGKRLTIGSRDHHHYLNHAASTGVAASADAESSAGGGGASVGAETCVLR